MGNACHSNGRKTEVLCRHREKYGAFQQRGKGTRRFMQPARRPVIANPQGEAIQCAHMDGFTPFAMTGRRAAIVVIRSCGELRGTKQSSPAYPHGRLHPAGSRVTCATI
jgi:hypothetical protein